MRIIIVFIGFLLLSGCMSPGEQWAANDDARCSSYGLNYGTPEYAQCRMTADQQRGAVLGQLADNMRAQEAQRVQQFQRDQQNYSRPQVNCTTMAMGGGTSSTTCR